MGHALTSSQAVDVANAMALEKARLGEGAKVVEVRRQLVAKFDGQDTARITLGALWPIQLAALAADNT